MRVYGAVTQGGVNRGIQADMSVNTLGISMKIHLAERDPQHHAWAKRGVENGGLKLRILLSYHYYKKSNLDELFAKYFDKPYPDVFADSGAFSAASLGAPIKIGEYIEWLNRWKHLFSVYSNLDVIGDEKGTERNQLIMEREGLAPLPVFHAGSDYKTLTGLTEKYKYIALGGLVAHSMNKKATIPHLIKCFKIAKGKSVFHGFGMTSWELMRMFRWYSVDSSSWGSGFRFGSVPLFDEQKGNFTKAQLGDIKSCKKASAIISRLGFDWRDFAFRQRNDRSKIAAISALSYMLAEKWLQKANGMIEIPSGQGLRRLDEDATPARFGDAVTGIRIHIADTSNGINYGDAQKGIKVYLAEKDAKLKDVRSVINESNSNS